MHKIKNRRALLCGPIDLRARRHSRRDEVPVIGDADGSAFTLIEMLIVVAITILLSTYVITYTGISRTQNALYTQEAKLGEAILNAKSLSIITKRENLDIPCGYGMRFDYGLGKYYLFSYSYNCGDIAPGYSMGVNDTYVDSGGNTLSRYTNIDSSDLEQGVVFYSGSQKLDTVFFKAPNPIAYIAIDGGSLQNVNSGNVYLRTVDGTAEKTISVSAPFGQVNF